MGSKIICNASPLIFLSKIERLHLLNDLFEEVFIPSSAWDEAVRKADSFTRDLQKLRSSGALRVFEVANRTAVSAMVGRLHIGEVEVIIGSGELGINNVILDDGYARSKAKQMALNVTGTLGLLIVACQKGIIGDINVEIDKLINTGFRISDLIIDQVKDKIK